MIQSGRGAVQGGFAKIIVMQEVPGRNLEDFPNLDIDDRDRVRVAFSRAIRYIVDLEDVKTHASAKFCPARDWRNWDIAGPVEKVVDPMVPPYKPYIIDPDDVTVQQMAVRAKGKPLRKDTY
ncbi:hypothetical protein PRK78_001971 [Emydomyces testavorans]|uniref:Uncharacterized protein n=1 Tax=Emydomyces testavorans TaxID=2070801 RepID=A0AAF0DEU6_9EURO|nr:hypothetical protein PRK78_001971 [Emydomyces testavorans]